MARATSSPRTLPRGLQPLASRNFRNVWIGSFISNIGTWVETVAGGIYITQLTGKASWTGIVAAAGLLPGAVLGPLGGALADRIARKPLLIITTLIEAISAAGLALLIAFDLATPLAITALVFIAGCAGVVAWPTFSTILPELIPAEQLPSAIALSTAQWNLGRIIGPIVAGVVIAIGGYTWAFAFNALSFIAVIIAILPIVIPRPKAPQHGVLRSIRAGLGYVRRDRGERVAIMLFAANCFLIAPFIALIPAVALKIFDFEQPGTSIMTTAQGVGAVIVAVSLGALMHRFRIRRVLRVAFFGVPFATALYAIAPTFALATAALVLLGGVYLGTFSGVMTVAQTRSTREVRGRVMSLFTSTLAVFYPLGSITQGWLGDKIGLRTTTLLGAGAMLVFLAGLSLIQGGFAPGLDDPLVMGAPGTEVPSTDMPTEVIPD
ncbi:MAG: MFS transporter [Acidimicrobiia bacterium]